MKAKIPYKEGLDLADRIKEELSPWCDEIEIAGSLRRKKPTIGDIEIVCIPKRQMNLFGEPDASLLDMHLYSLLSDGRLLQGDKNGDNYKNFYIPALPELKLDLFITNPECWPVIFAIRTGSANFSRRLVTQKNKGGLLPSEYNVSKGRVWDRGIPLDLSSERNFLELCGGWVEPEERL